MAAASEPLILQISEDLVEQLVDNYAIAQADDTTIYALEHLTFWHLLPPTQGALSAKLTVGDLTGNSVVEDFKVKVKAARADQALAAQVAELRGEDADGANMHHIIVDFGTVRTVSAALISLPGRIELVEAWNGSEFPPPWPTVPPFQLSDPAPTSPGFARFRSDVRTERLRITLFSEEARGDLLGDLRVILPDTPKDLAISINGGPPVWTLPGPSAKGPDSTLSVTEWNNANERIVDLTEALAALTGDPLNPASQAFELELTSREAGNLQISEHSRSVKKIRRASFNGSARTSVKFAAEGITSVALVAPGTPSGAMAERVTFLASGEMTPDRRMPAIGPDPKLIDGTETPLVDMEITPEKSVIFRLVANSGVPLFSGLRLPLKAGPNGAELRLVPVANAGPGRVQPYAPLEEFTGTPVTLDSTDAPVWTSLLFADPMEIDPANPPWVALVAARGTVTIALSDLLGAIPRVGPPSGPWREMPGLFGATPFGALRIPFRTIGDAADPQITPPLKIDMPGTPLTPAALDPIPDGTTISLELGAVTNPALRITHFTEGALDLDQVDIVFDQ